VSLFRYTKAHVLEKGISSRDEWQTEFFLIHSYFALMADYYGIFSSLLGGRSTSSGEGQQGLFDEGFIEKEVFPSLFISPGASCSYLWIFLREISRYGSILIVEYFVLNQDQHNSAVNNHGRQDFSQWMRHNAINFGSADHTGPFGSWEYVGYDDGESNKSIEESISLQLNQDVKSILYLGAKLELLFGSHCSDRISSSFQQQSKSSKDDIDNRMHNILSLLGMTH
jgi:hypothetical protein